MSVLHFQLLGQTPWCLVLVPGNIVHCVQVAPVGMAWHQPDSRQRPAHSHRAPGILLYSNHRPRLGILWHYQLEPLLCTRLRNVDPSPVRPAPLDGSAGVLLIPVRDMCA